VSARRVRRIHGQHLRSLINSNTQQFRLYARLLADR
jgi:hypothetical protein